MGAYFYSSWRLRIAPPVPEAIVNILLVAGVILNIVLCAHLNTPSDTPWLWLIFILPIILMYLEVLHRNYRAIKSAIADHSGQPGTVGNLIYRFLCLRPFLQWPLLAVLALPLLLLFSLILYLFGQQPDTLIRAFTDTYKHGFSQLDYQCDNVQCGGHYLCSVPANGHRPVVGSFRYGRRNGGRIICNRQLLVSNAFEQLLEEKIPQAHRAIRRRYDRVGDLVHRHYRVFANPYFSDFIYLLMKPAEWCFLLVLYCFDRKPENRIARQYL